jgi:RHS repeat-associated protein
VCYRYDGYQRLTAAWTATDDCATTPTTSNNSMVGGDVPMWLTWDFTVDGQRTSQVNYQTPGSSVTTATTAYTYAVAGHQHGLSTASTSGGTSPASVTYTYDAAGNTATRTTTPTTGTAVTDTFTYTPTGRVSTVSNPTGTSSYLYDADGTTLIRTDPLTGTTLYLGGTEVRLAVGSSTLAATRYYSFAGMTIAQRDTSTGLKALYNDPQGTSLVAVSWTNLASRTRRTTSPYGVELGLRNGPWPNPLGYGNQPVNTHLGLVDMGARLYDRDNGRFLSPDPVIDLSHPDSLGGYTYAADDPINRTDFNGLRVDQTDYAAGIAAERAANTSATQPPAKPSSYWGGVVNRVAQGAVPLLFVAGLGTQKGCTEAAAAGAVAIINGWQATSGYVTSIPNKTPGEFLADANAFQNGFGVGALGVLEDTVRGLSPTKAVSDLAYIFTGYGPPRLADMLTSLAASNGINTNSVPYVIGQAAGTIAATVTIAAVTGGAGGAARAGTVVAKDAAQTMAGVRAAGQSGEDLAGIVKNTTRIPSATGKAAYRIPDELNSSVLGEVKNVKSLGWTSQISDMYAYATARGLEFVLYVRSSTVFRGQLAELYRYGGFTRVDVPRMPR